MNDQTALVPTTFDGINVNTLVDTTGPEPVPYFIPREVGEAIGYADPAELSKLIKKRWSEDLAEGEDYVRFNYAELNEKFKGAETPPFDFSRRGMTLLTEEGLYAVLMLTRAPKSRAFRKWIKSEVMPSITRTLVEEILPSIAKTGTYTAPSAPAIDPLEAMRLELAIIKARTAEKRHDFRALLHSEKKMLPVEPDLPATPPSGWISAHDLSFVLSRRLGISVSAKIITDVAKSLGILADRAVCYVHSFHISNVRQSDGEAVLKPATRNYFNPTVFDRIEAGVAERPVSAKQLKKLTKGVDRA